jgi:hypothetical protein
LILKILGGRQYELCLSVFHRLTRAQLSREEKNELATDLMETVQMSKESFAKEEFRKVTPLLPFKPHIHVIINRCTGPKFLISSRNDAFSLVVATLMYLRANNPASSFKNMQHGWKKLLRLEWLPS